MKILAFESTCDETAVAVVEDGRKILTEGWGAWADMAGKLKRFSE